MSINIWFLSTLYIENFLYVLEVSYIEEGMIKGNNIKYYLDEDPFNNYVMIAYSLEKINK